MGKTIQDILKAQNLLPEYTVKEDLDNYKHIELTEDEMDEAVLAAKKRKEEKLKEIARQQKATEGREALMALQWDWERMSLYARERAAFYFRGAFKLDEYNNKLFCLLCAYYANDPAFDGMALAMDIKDASLKKGIMLVGNFGVGKTWLMKVFQKNPKQSFQVRNAKDIVEEFRFAKDKEAAIEQFVIPPRNAVNDASVFYQPVMGLCIDDMGTEDLRNDYGNKQNVIGDILELRYSKGFIGPLLNITSNLTAKQLGEYYGGRVVSRLREIVNFIELPGNDRRK